MQRAFTLVEMVLTLVIMGIIVAIAVPRIASASESSRLDAAEKRIISEFYAVRDRARATGESYAIRIRLSGDSIRVWKNDDRTGSGVVRDVVLSDPPYEVDITTRTVATADKYIVVDGYGMFDASAKLTIQAGAISRSVDLALPFAATDTADVGGLSAGR